MTNITTKIDSASARRSSGAWLGVSISLGMGLLAILVQPSSPWWLTADCDLTYLGSALNLYAGEPTEFFDHPGIPLQALLMFSLAADHAIQSLSEPITRAEYVDAALVNMEPAIWMIRLWAGVFFIGGVVVASEVGRRTLGHWSWGVLATLLFMASIGHLGRAVMFKPDNPVSALSLLSTFLIIAGCQERRVGKFVAGLIVIGFAITVKVHALGLVPVAGVGMLLMWREDWTGQLAVDLRTFWSRRWMIATIVVVLVAFPAFVISSARPVPEIDLRALAGGGALLIYLAVSILAQRGGRSGLLQRTVFHPMLPIAVLSVGAGLAVTCLLLPDQAIMMLRYLFYAGTGRGINSGFDPRELLSSVVAQWTTVEMLMQLPFVVLAGVGAWRIMMHGQRVVLLWAVAAVSMFILAAMRGVVHPSAHHYGPAMVLCMPLVLAAVAPSRILACFGRPALEQESAEAPKMMETARCNCGVLSLAIVLAVVVLPITKAVRGSWNNQDRCHAIASLTDELSTDLGDDQFIMADFWAHNGEAAHFMLVRDFCRYTPPKDYRSLPDTPTALEYAASKGMSPAYYMTFDDRQTKVRATDDGTLIARSAWGHEWYVRKFREKEIPQASIRVYEVLGRADLEATDPHAQGE